MDKRQKMEEVTLSQLIELYLETTPGNWTVRSLGEDQSMLIPLHDPTNKKQPLIATMSIGHLRPNGEANSKFIPLIKNSFPQLIMQLVNLTMKNKLPTLHDDDDPLKSKK